MVYISLLIIISYIIYSIIKNKKIPDSLSATYYDNGIWFSISLLSSLFLIIYPMLEITPENWKFLAFFTILGLSFVGFSPDYRSNSLVDKVHTGMALFGTISSQIWILIMNPYILLSWIICLFVDKSKLLFVSEIIALLNIYIALCLEMKLGL